MEVPNIARTNVTAHPHPRPHPTPTPRPRGTSYLCALQPQTRGPVAEAHTAMPRGRRQKDTARGQGHVPGPDPSRVPDHVQAPGHGHPGRAQDRTRAAHTPTLDLNHDHTVAHAHEPPHDDRLIDQPPPRAIATPPSLFALTSKPRSSCAVMKKPSPRCAFLPTEGGSALPRPTARQ